MLFRSIDVLGRSEPGLPYPELIVSKKPLDASKTYLVIVVEHPDEAIRG